MSLGEERNIGRLSVKVVTYYAFTGLVAPVPVTLCGRDEPPAVAAACYGSVGAGTALRVTPDGSAEKFPGF